MIAPRENLSEKQESAGSHNDFNTFEDDLIDSIWTEKKSNDPYQEGIMLFFVHLFFGFGMFYIKPTNKRKWIYPIFAFFAWLSYVNVFVKVIPVMEEFQNRSMIGASTIFVSWFITYVIGYFDIYREFLLKFKR